MGEKATLALAVPAYNAAAFLPRLLQSAHNQTQPFDEIWIYDDCSTDATHATALALGARVLRGSVNVGCTAGKRRLIDVVTSEWVHFHDADDELLPTFVENIHGLILTHDVDAIIVGSEERSEFDSRHRAVSTPNPQELADDPLLYSVRNKVNAISSVNKRSFLIEHDILNVDHSMLYNEDQAIQLNLVIAGARFASTPEVLVRSYQQKVSMSQSNQLNCVISHFRVMQAALEYSRLSGDKEEVRRAIAERLWGVAAVAPRLGDFGSAMEAARLARTLGPVPTTAGGSVFRLLGSVSPELAILVREYATRFLKPHLLQQR